MSFIKNVKSKIILLIVLFPFIFLQNVYGGIMLNLTWSANTSFNHHYRIKVEKINPDNETIPPDSFYKYSKDNYCEIELDEGFVYSFQVQSVNDYGIYSQFSEKITYSTTGLNSMVIEDLKYDHQELSLNQNQPNPFNPSTAIIYYLPERVHVNLTIYNIQGQKIVVLQDEIMETGKHSVMWNAAGMPSGTYFCTLRTKDLLKTNKMLLIK